MEERDLQIYVEVEEEEVEEEEEEEEKGQVRSTTDDPLNGRINNTWKTTSNECNSSSKNDLYSIDWSRKRRPISEVFAFLSNSCTVQEPINRRFCSIMIMYKGEKIKKR